MFRIMGILGRAIQTGGIWLTAIMMLVAGTPHLDCRCANGRIKPFCLSLFTGQTNCCGVSCCSAFPEEGGKTIAADATRSAATPKKTCCCCKSDQENPTDDLGNAPQLRKAGCQKTLVEAAVAVSESAGKISVQHLTNRLLVLAPQPMMRPDEFASADWLSARPHHWPPPSDLVTVLQRLVI